MKNFKLIRSAGLLLLGLLGVIVFVTFYLGGADMYQYNPVLFIAVAVALQGIRGIIKNELQLKQLAEYESGSIKLLYNMISLVIICLLLWAVAWIIFDKLGRMIFALLLL